MMTSLTKTTSSYNLFTDTTYSIYLNTRKWLPFNRIHPHTLKHTYLIKLQLEEIQNPLNSDYALFSQTVSQSEAINTAEQ